MASTLRPIVVCCILAAAMQAAEAGGSAGNTTPITTILFGFIVVLLAAKLGGEAVERLGQPAVLGELAAGIVLGNLVLAGLPWFEAFKHDHSLQLLAEIGVILLLFQVGLESHTGELLAVGASAMMVANLGVILPMILGYAVRVLPAAGGLVRAPVRRRDVGGDQRRHYGAGAPRLQKTETKEARIVLSAAVIDDVLGLIVLAVVCGMVASVARGGNAELEWRPVAMIVRRRARSGGRGVRRTFDPCERAEGRGALSAQGITLALAICFCFGLAGWRA